VTSQFISCSGDIMVRPAIHHLHICTTHLLSCPHQHQVNHEGHLGWDQVPYCTFFFSNNVFIIVNWFRTQDYTRCSPATFLSSRLHLPSTFCHASSSGFRVPTGALKSPNDTKMPFLGTLSNVSYNSQLNFSFTARRALAARASYTQWS